MCIYPKVVAVDECTFFAHFNEILCIINSNINTLTLPAIEKFIEAGKEINDLSPPVINRKKKRKKNTFSITCH